MNKFDYLIVGAGFAGSVCAERLASAGKSVLLIDQRAHIGGNAYDYYDDHGILVHRYGAHIFHTNSRDVFDYLSQFTEWRPYQHRVLSVVGGELLPVPINATTLEFFHGSAAAARKAMIEPYTRKQWGEHAADLSPAVLARLPIRSTHDGRYFTDEFQCMPLHGYTRLFERMLASPRIKRLLQCSYREVIAGFGDCAPEIIYTGPIDEFFDYRFGRLPYRSATFEFETHDQMHLQPVAVVNYPDEAVSFTRSIEFKRLTGQAHRMTTVAYEYPRSNGEPFWPVPTAASAERYREYAAAAAGLSGVHFVGRLGTFKYLDMHAVVAQALKLTAALLAKEPVHHVSDTDRGRLAS